METQPTPTGRPPGTTSLKTILVAIAFAALFSTVATQIYTLIVPTRSALWLLLLFFIVGLGVAWVTVRIDAREERAKALEAEAADAPPADAPPGDAPP